MHALRWLLGHIPTLVLALIMAAMVLPLAFIPPGGDFPSRAPAQASKDIPYPGITP